MTPFDYTRASDTAQAIAALHPGGQFLAGGTNLVDHLKLGLARPAQIVDINRLPLTAIEETASGPCGGCRLAARRSCPDRGGRLDPVRRPAYHCAATG